MDKQKHVQYLFYDIILPLFIPPNLQYLYNITCLFQLQKHTKSISYKAVLLQH